ncbi:hypothetical protein C8R45DRAFT_953968 [Mycena sanguinolenta]|nr:hypothetical protein C8R45DRAFT_953968 [Mycena sanguinolenta]
MGIWTTVVVVAVIWAVGECFFPSNRGDSEDGDSALPPIQRLPVESPEERARRLGLRFQTPNQYQRLESPEERAQRLGQARSHRYAAVRQQQVDRIIPQRDDPSLSAEELRERATEAYKRKNEAFSQSKMMRRAGMATEAQRLAQEGKEHQRTMERYNKAASEMIFRENNKDRNPNEVDLHRLYVKEAKLKVKEAILAAKKRQDDSSVRFIVGQGHHSDNGAQLKPKLKSYIAKHLGYPVLEDAKNAGVLIVIV